METTANGYRVVYEGGEGEIVEKKSKFIANIFYISFKFNTLSIFQYI